MTIRKTLLLLLCVVLCLFTVGCRLKIPEAPVVSLDEIPPFSGDPFVAINNNQPLFTQEDLTTEAYEYYSPLDTLGRCGDVTACLGRELMPTEERGSIGSVKPSGWKTLKFDQVDGKYLYNRCHLIGFQLSGENANECNLITGTRYLNVDGMLPFENMVADYIKETDNHVMYRVIPVFDGDNLLASGVTIEAYSVEDNGEGICFYVYCYNAQPDIAIDYRTGDAAVADNTVLPGVENTENTKTDDIGHYILNVNSKKVHKEDCRSGQSISEKNKQNYDGALSDLLDQGYETADCCFE